MGVQDARGACERWSVRAQVRSAWVINVFIQILLLFPQI